MAQSNIWNGSEQWDIDPETGQYRQAPPVMQAATPQAGIDWGSVEQQLRSQAAAQGLDYDPSDLEGIRRHTGYNVGGSTLDQALQNQFNVYGQRAATQQTGGNQPQQPQYQTPTQQWNAQPAVQGQSDELFKLLMQRAQQATTVNRNDPNIRAQVDPMVAQQERASRNYIDDIAEKSGPLANIQGERRLMAERGGQAAGQLEAEIIGREQDARRQEIMQSLGLAGEYMTADKQLALQKELGYLMDASRTADRDLSRQGLLQSNDQFLRELALREFDLGNKWDYNWQMGF